MKRIIRKRKNKRYLTHEGVEYVTVIGCEQGRSFKKNMGVQCHSTNKYYPNKTFADNFEFENGWYNLLKLQGEALKDRTSFLHNSPREWA